MAAPSSHSTAPVTIRDRRVLPFFQVHLGAVRAIREHASGPRRLRAIGLYAYLCQLANEQRHVGDHVRVQASYEVLCRRARIGAASLSALLDALAKAGVVRLERVPDLQGGSVITVLHLDVQGPPWIAFTVTAAERLAERRQGGHFLRDLGLVVTLLELCVEQRRQHGGLRAEVRRAELVELTGLAVRQLDHCHGVLEDAGVLQICRRRLANGGRHLPSIYTIIEPAGDGNPQAASRNQGAGLEVAASSFSSAAAQEQNSQGAGLEVAGSSFGTASAQDQNSQGADRATDTSETAPSSARAGDLQVEERLESFTPPNPPSHTEVARGGAETLLSAAELCEALVATWTPILGAKPRRHFEANRSGWLRAAERLLADHPAGRLHQALAYATTDEILGSRALTMPDFVHAADQLIARAHARSQRQAGLLADGHGAAVGIGWAQAQHHLERLIARHGRGGRQAALAELARLDGRFEPFVREVRWTQLCDTPMHFRAREYAARWVELGSESHQHGEEAS
ncbi:MAG: hypothetical protein JOZ64_12095 [Solirubrobacterales bacterium]|nr:hypothetical protein [Solirubrobacterales bacterium]